MRKRCFVLIGSFLCAICGLVSTSFGEDGKTLLASLALIPGSINSADEGPFVDLLKGLGPYTGREITIKIFPFSRSVFNVTSGAADFHMPAFKNQGVDENGLDFHFINEKFGRVSFVIYSNADNPITKKMIDDALANKGPFPYTFEGPAALDFILGVPCLPSPDPALSLQKVVQKKIDGLIWSQEAPDNALRDMKTGSIRREHWADFDSVIIVAKGPRGDETDALLSEAIRKMRADNKLDTLYERVHRPYDPWQPADMGWAPQK